MKKRWSAILFDLDGALLPMDNDAFTQGYFKYLCKRFREYDAEALVAAVWKGTKAMMNNDGTMTNEQRFWETFAGIMGPEVLRRTEEFEDFYRTDFHLAKSLTAPNPLAEEIVRRARDAADRVVLATNPLFPRCGVETRLSWIGLKPSDFDLVTTYETARFCKPSPGYYQDILNELALEPGKCLMVGNDVAEDAQAAMAMGMSAYLIGDYLINRAGAPLPCPTGSWRDYLDFAGGGQ